MIKTFLPPKASLILLRISSCKYTRLLLNRGPIHNPSMRRTYFYRPSDPPSQEQLTKTNLHVLSDVQLIAINGKRA